jgi:hypothetical protein
MSFFQHDLHDYYSGHFLRIATRAESIASRKAAKYDGGAGVILIDDGGRILSAGDRFSDDARRVYVVQ